MHAAELDAPVAELYVPADKRPGEQSQLPSALKIDTQHSPFTFPSAKKLRLAAPVSNAAKRLSLQSACRVLSVLVKYDLKTLKIEKLRA